VADAPNFERYDEKFDPVTGNGGLEVWVQIKTSFAAALQIFAIASQAPATLP
jgi:hypothetical protein